MTAQGDGMTRGGARRRRIWTHSGGPPPHRGRLLVLAVTALLVGGTALVGGPAAQGAGRDTDDGGDDGDGAHGQHIVWSQFVDLDFSGARIMVSDPKGRHARPLTKPAPGVVDIDPKISPNGRWVAWERDDTQGNGHLMLVRIDGRDEHEVDIGCVDPCLSANGPTWTPDGRHLIFEKVIGPIDPHGNAASALLWMTDLDGDHVVRLSDPALDNVVEDFGAQFAPAGYMIVNRLNLARDKTAIFRMDADGTNACRLTPWALSADTSDVSPATGGATEDLAVFETYGHGGVPPGEVSSVATVRATCGGEHDIRYVTSPDSDPVWHFNPAWSPDGRHLVFVRFKSVDGDPIVHGDLVTSRWNGEDRDRIATSPLFDFRPDWGRAPSD